MLRRLYSDEDGTTTLEYALLVLLITVSGLLVWQALSAIARDDTTDLSMRWPTSHPTSDIMP